jgi:hypothetical protein
VTTSGLEIADTCHLRLLGLLASGDGPSRWHNRRMMPAAEALAHQAVGP